jgi:hypothetical protein
VVASRWGSPKMTLPFISGCILQIYLNVPRIVVLLSGDGLGKRCGNVCVKDSPGFKVPERNVPAGLVANTVCWMVPSLTH